MLARRSILIGLPLLGWRIGPASLRALALAQPKRVAVVFTSAAGPCAEAADGIRTRLTAGDLSLDFLDLSKTTFESDLSQALLRRPSLVVAVGSDAQRAIAGKVAPAATVSSMTLEADQAPAAQAARVRGAVYLDLPVRTLAAEMRKLFPDKTRIGVIRNPGRRDPSTAALHGQGAETTAIQVADCAAPDELLPLFLGFRKKVDFVICLPDGALYNGATVRPLIMASLESRLPIVGFSPAFLRAGAAVAVYPDYHAVGQQTADLVRRCLEPGEAASENPKKVKVSVNAKILRMLGMEFSAPDHPEVEVMR